MEHRLRKDPENGHSHFHPMKDTVSDLTGSPTESFKGFWESSKVSILSCCLSQAILASFPLAILSIPYVGHLHSCNHCLDLILLSKGSKFVRTPKYRSAILLYFLWKPSTNKRFGYSIENIAKLLGLSARWTCLSLAHKI